MVIRLDKRFEREPRVAEVVNDMFTRLTLRNMVIASTRIGEFAMMSAFVEDATTGENLKRQWGLVCEADMMNLYHYPIIGRWHNLNRHLIYISSVDLDAVRMLAKKFSQSHYLWGREGFWMIYKTYTGDVVSTGYGVDIPDEIPGADGYMIGYSQYASKKSQYEDVLYNIDKLAEKIEDMSSQPHIDEKKLEHLKKTREGYIRKSRELLSQLERWEDKLGLGGVMNEQ
jgi:hypothetical protein